jgi:hypothetical protein
MSALGCSLLLAVASLGREAAGEISSADLESHVAAARKARSNCGPVCVWFCLRRLGHEVDVTTVLQRAEMGEHGIRLDRLVTLAQDFGLPAKAVVFDPKRLDAVPRPAILVIGQSHCVVLGAVDAFQGQARVFEPSSGRVANESTARLTARWGGEAIVFAEPPMAWHAFAALAALAWGSTIVGVVLVSSVGRHLARKRRARKLGGTAATTPTRQTPAGSCDQP